MYFPRQLSGRAVIAAQIALVLCGLGSLALFPPAAGRMILIPFSGDDAARIVPVALVAGASLIARGPFPGSIVINGRRDRLATATAGLHVLTLAAPFAGCGAPTGGA